MRSTRASIALLAGLAAAVVWRRAGLFPVRVAGVSMEPTLFEGDRLAVSAAIAPRVGDVVVVRRNGMEFVKRIASMHDGVAALRGDNRKASTDFSTTQSDIAAVALGRYWPKPRRLR